MRSSWDLPYRLLLGLHLRAALIKNERGGSFTAQGKAKRVFLAWHVVLSPNWGNPSYCPSSRSYGIALQRPRPWLRMKFILCRWGSMRGFPLQSSLG